MQDLKDLPLLAVMEEELDPPSDQNGRMTDTLYNWYRMVYVLSNTSSHPSAPTLWKSMSSWHRQSFRMLFDWWTASYQDPSWSLAAILSIVDQCNAVDLHEFKQKEGKKPAETVILELLELKRWPEGDIMPPPKLDYTRAIASGYHDHMKSLFLFEFNRSYESEGRQGRRWDERRQARSMAAQSAFCQQTAWQLLEQHEGVLEIANSDFQRIFGAEKHQQTDLKVRGAIIESCPWLPPVSERDLPHYLWDVDKGKTVESSKLQCRPKYTAISHTWGRWATGKKVQVAGVADWRVPKNTRFRVEEIPEILRRAPFNTPYVWLDLCCIPQEPGSAIGASEIARQAQIFRNAQVVVAWLNDLDEFQVLGDILKWKALQLLHLRTDSKQKTRDDLVTATQQRCAKKPTGLLAGPQSMTLKLWFTFLWTLKRKALQLLHLRTGSKQKTRNDLVTETRRRGAKKPTSLPAGPRFRDFISRSMTLNPWFTSLWTLQEVAMRPDMWVSAKDWSMLSVDGVNALPLSGLLAIFEFSSYLSDNKDLRGLGLAEMQIWRLESGLCKLLSLDQATLLNLGDRRQCTGRRAESIMSALGATQWYEEILRDVPRGNETELRDRLEKDLVLGKYPLSFVQEVSRTVPGDFFGSYLKLESIMDGGENGPDVSNAHGSMLPFSASFSTSSEIAMLGSRFRTECSRVFADTHRTVHTWEVRATGEVHIGEACVVSSSVGGVGQCSPEGPRIIAAKTTPRMSIEEHLSPLTDEFLSRYGGGRIDYTDPSWFDLNLWISCQPTTHAIVTEFIRWDEEGLVDGPLECSGIIIQEIQRGTLVKTAHFHFYDVELVMDLLEVKEVNWLVA